MLIDSVLDPLACCIQPFDLVDESEPLPLRLRPRIPPVNGFLLALPEFPLCW